VAKFRPKRILCPVDFSAQSAAALRLAGRVAMPFGAEVLVLHAHRLEAPVYFTRAQTQALKAQLRRTTKSGRAYLRDFANQRLPEKVPHSIMLADRDPVSAIQRAIRDWRPGLVVMATHGRTGLTRLRLGSVMESVLRQSTVPVLTEGPGVKSTLSSAPVRRVLCPVDLEDSSQAAFQHAATLVEATGAELIALHVAKDRADAQAQGAIREQLCAWVPGNLRDRCSIREVIRWGHPAEQIIAEAKSTRADLVVIEARPRRFLHSILFGSTTESVIRSSPIPVLSVIKEPIIPDEHGAGTAPAEP
jgi:nucleotide-binding universal stress UspA family protein